MGILNRWRQFGRRYFWPHLLLGVVAASIGAPSNLNGLPQQISLSTAALNINRINSAVPGVGQLVLLSQISNRPLQNLNPWQQFAIRNYLTRLVVAFPQDEPTLDTIKNNEEDGKILVSHLALLDSLSILFSTNLKVPAVVSLLVQIDSSFIQPTVGLWLAKVQGIRAGPSANA
ncbi:MAG: secA regulator SecM [Budvicia sp.]|nr:secA translation cis-regulator SecM [Budvicia aquatica]MBP9642505.1 secA regulator SecM [Budvicia sp.]GKX50126.1 secretion monitor [Budvicia aquatica]